MESHSSSTVDMSLISQGIFAALFPQHGRGGETVGLITKTHKFNRHGQSQERILILSNQSIFLVSQKKVHSKFNVADLQYYIKALQSNEFIVHIENTKEKIDVRLMVDNRAALEMIMKRDFAALCPDRTLRFYGIPGKSLQEYKTNNALHLDNEPEQKFRLKDQETAGHAPDIVEEHKQEQDPNAFDFSNRHDNQMKKKGLKAGQLDIDQDNLSGHMENLVLNQNESNLQSVSNSPLVPIDSVDDIQDLKMLQDFRDNGQSKKKQISSRQLTKEEKEHMAHQCEMMCRTTRKEKEIEVKFTDFQMKMVLGRGAFGKVFLAQLSHDKQLYAVKAIRKDLLIETDQVKSTLLEKEILMECDHPFLVGMDYAFQSEQRIYFVMPFIRGGELYKIYQSQKRFSEDTVRFYAAQLIMALGYLHGKGIVHRDLKLENILVDQEGYIRLIDYGLAKMLKDNEQAMTFCGTPEYLAPEMVSQVGHGKEVDWWAVGVIMYEMLIGVTPFYHANRNMQLLKIRVGKVIFPDKSRYRLNWSNELEDLITKLLTPHIPNRIGTQGGASEILKHPFFASLDMKKVLNRQVVPSFKPPVADKFGDVGFAQFFDQQDNAAMKDTYIPRQNRAEIKSHNKKGDFDGFDMKMKKK